ncbi:MAG: hypothetical protein VX398_01525, partial [Acidobacteriota bacterium]|nr:hypothetical protein [Acidobacteriota bacterium]
MRNFVEDVCLDVLRVGLSVVSNSYVLVLLSIFLAVVPAEAQQVNERMRSTFARAEMLYRTAEPDQAIEPLTDVIEALLSNAMSGDIDDEGQALLVRSLAYRA